MERKLFTEDEDNLLKKFYPNKNISYLIKRLPKRSINSIYIRANRLKIKKSISYNKKLRIYRMSMVKFLKKLNTKKLKSNKLNTDSAYLLGSILADGHISNRRVYVCSKDYDFVDTLKKIYEKWSGLKSSIKNYKTRYGNNLYHVFFNSKEAANFFRSVNLDKIRVNKLKAKILKGLFDAEGSITVYDRYRKDRDKIYLAYSIVVCNSDPKLIEVIKRFLKDLNINYGWRRYINLNSYTKNPKYIVKISQKSLLTFYKKIGFGMKRKREKLEKLIILKTTPGGYKNDR